MAPQTRHKVLVARREPGRRSMTRRALEAGGMTVCAEARDARTAVAAALRERPDLCLLAVDIEEGGIFATREIRRRLPETAVVVTGGGTHLDDAFGALQAGAAGFLPDEMNPRTIGAGASGGALR
jgi:DNA-binding NarL/FixJ family response regulator